MNVQTTLTPMKVQEELNTMLQRLRLLSGSPIAMVAFTIPTDEAGNFQGCFINATFKLDQNNCIPLLHTMITAIAQGAGTQGVAQ